MVQGWYILLYLHILVFQYTHSKHFHHKEEKILIFALSSCPNKFNHALQSISDLKRYSKYPIDCIISVHVSREEFLLLKWDQQAPRTVGNLLLAAERICRVYFIPGAHYGDNIRMVFPFLLKKADYTYILFLQDDIRLNNYKLDDAVILMKHYNLSMGSPLVDGAAHLPVQWSSDTTYTGNERAAGVKPAKMIEAFVVLFTMDGWDCFWDACDPLYNSKGWGFDLILYAICRAKYNSYRMGVFLNMVVTHLRGAMPCQLPSYTDNHRLDPQQQCAAFTQTDTFRRYKQVQDAVSIDWDP